jgi:DNA-binding FadR family transcriptional regulator
MSFLNIGVEASKRANKGHERILEAIEKGDEAGAFFELERHIIDADRAYHTVRNTIQKNTETPRSMRAMKAGMRSTKA